jgi:hypothetical protein
VSELIYRMGERVGTQKLPREEEFILKIIVLFQEWKVGGQ